LYSIMGLMLGIVILINLPRPIAPEIYAKGSTVNDIQSSRYIQICCAWGSSLLDGKLSFKIIGGDTTAQKAVKNAVDKWNSKLTGISLIEASENENADIIINFKQDAIATNVDTVSLEGRNIRAATAGQSVNNFDSNGLLVNSIITISRSAFDNTLSSNKIEQIALHELGHALGLGHANFNGDLMSAVITGRKKVISSCDSNGVIAANQWKILEKNNGDIPDRPSVQQVLC
jgi:predicted Zn-dependent protease